MIGPRWDEGRSREVIVLGAGFSKALSGKFPLTDELGRYAEAVSAWDNPTRSLIGLSRTTLDQLQELAENAKRDHFPGGTFEAWLSSLAEPQPYLTQAQNAANWARFLGLVNAVHDVLWFIEPIARSEAPAWLFRLVSALHYTRATVVTFNYDLMIEWALEQLNILSLSAGPHGPMFDLVRWFEPLARVPFFPPVPARLHGEPIDTFRLCKLHGSLNWYWVPGDVSGATLHHSDSLDDNRSWLRRFLPGREPFIVPPASIKSGFFRNPLIAQTWREAYESLREASKVWLVGYSLPMTDLAAAGMLATSVGRGPVEASIEVVNPDASAVIARVMHLTGQVATSVLSAEEFAASYVEHASRQLTQRLKRIDTTAEPRPVEIGWQGRQRAWVQTVERVNDTVRLNFDRFEDQDHARPESGPLDLARLQAMLLPGDRLEAWSTASSRSFALVGDVITDRQLAPPVTMLVPADHFATAQGN